ncbi:MAG: ABC transporter substrate-binding protein, partial [Pseudolysinimonas sp.]
QFIGGDLSGALKDVKVRQALMYAIDRNGTITAAEGGFATPTVSGVVKSLWTGAGADSKFVDDLYGSLNPYSLNLDKAKSLIKAAGAAGKSLTIAVPSGLSSAKIDAQAVASAADSIGLKSKVDIVPGEKYGSLFTDAGARKGVDLFWTSWFVAAGTPLAELTNWNTNDPSNYGGYSNPEYDQLVAQARSTSDDKERLDLMAKATKIQNRDVPWIPLYDTNMLLFTNKRITGVAPSIAFYYEPWAAMIGAAK